MFDIEYKGANGLVISTKGTSVVIDPKLSLVGLKDLDCKDKVQLVTEERFKVANTESRVLFEYPGDYEVGDFSISGIAAQRHIDDTDAGRQSTMYRIEVADVRLAVLGNIAPALDEEQLEGLGVVDILVLPVGGNGYTLDATSAAAIVRQIEPKVIIPVHYADEQLQYEVAQEDIELFIKESGYATETVTGKYKVKSSALPEVATVVCLERSK